MTQAADIFPQMITIFSSGGVGAFIIWLLDRNKRKAETENLVADTQHTIIQDLRGEMNSMKDQIKSFIGKEETYMKMIANQSEEKLILNKELQAIKLEQVQLKEDHKRCAENEKNLNNKLSELRRDFNEQK